METITVHKARAVGWTDGLVAGNLRADIVAEARTWLGTPYHACADLKGIGVDCAMLMMRVYAAAGLVEFVDPRPYDPQWALHHAEEMYIAWLERMGAHRVQAPALGDIALFQWGRCFSHGGIVVEAPGPVDDAQVLHAYLGHGVNVTRLREAPLDGRPRQFWTFPEHLKFVGSNSPGSVKSMTFRSV